MAAPTGAPRHDLRDARKGEPEALGARAGLGVAFDARHLQRTDGGELAFELHRYSTLGATGGRAERGGHRRKRVELGIDGDDGAGRMRSRIRCVQVEAHGLPDDQRQPRDPHHVPLAFDRTARHDADGALLGPLAREPDEIPASGASADARSPAGKSETEGDRATCNGEIRILCRQRDGAFLGGRERREKPLPDAGRTKDTTVQQHRVRDDVRRQVPLNEGRHVTRDRRIAFVGKPEADQCRSRRAGCLALLHEREEAVDDDRLGLRSPEHRGMDRADEARTTSEDADRFFFRRGVAEQALLRGAAGEHELREEGRLQTRLFRQRLLDRVGECEVHVVAAEEQMSPDGDAFEMHLAAIARAVGGRIAVQAAPHADQRQIRRSAADVGDEHERLSGFSPDELAERSVAVRREIPIESSQRLFQEPDPEPRLGGGPHRQLACDLVERRGHGENELLFGEGMTRMLRVVRAPDVLQDATARLDR
jgi:hypothetical protein